MRTTSGLRRTATILSASFAMLLLMATAAWAPKTLNLPAVDGPCTSGGENGYFLGEFTPTRFVRASGGLSVQGRMSATCDLPRDDVALTGATTRVRTTIVNSDCRVLVLELGSGRTRGVSYDLEGDLMVFDSDVDDPLLCRVATVWDNPRKLVTLLNSILATT